MILSDLLHSTVTSADGGKLGLVSDARFVLDGAPHQLLADARLIGLIVSPRSASSFLGYERHNTASPWPIAQLLRWHHRGSFLLLWEHIDTITAGHVAVRKSFRPVDPALPPSP